MVFAVDVGMAVRKAMLDLLCGQKKAIQAECFAIEQALFIVRQLLPLLGTVAKRLHDVVGNVTSKSPGQWFVLPRRL